MIDGCKWLSRSAVIAALLVVAACGDPDGEADTGGEPVDGGSDVADTEDGADAGDADDTSAAPDTGVDADGGADADAADAADAGPPPIDDAHCDPLDRSRCALPWPSNKYLAADSERETGHELQFGDETLPAVSGGPHTDPEPYRRFDGYGVGQPIMAAFDNLDASDLPNERQIEQSMAEDAQILLYRVDGDSLTRVPYWAELDAKADADADTKMLLVRPAVILDEATRYIVAFRGLKHRDGSAIEPSEAFQRLRSGTTRPGGSLAARQQRFDEIFDLLEGAGVDRQNLTLAWDFVTASSEAIHGRMLQMRDRGFEITGPKGPKLTIDEVERHVPSDDDTSRPVDPNKALLVTGTFRVPRFMERVEIDGLNGWVFHLDDEGNPTQNGWKESPFWLVVPHSAINDAPQGQGPVTGNGKAHGLFQYGHGMLWAGEAVDRDYNRRIANEHNFLAFGATLWGMSEEDQQTAIGAVSNLSKFQFMGDRLHQGMLEYLLLARAIKKRLADTQVASDYGLNIDEDELYYTGISQGGIFGGTYMALSTDAERGHLGATGSNYSLLLDRSRNFDRFFDIMKGSYPNRLDQLIGVATIQLLWGQTDSVSYMRHIRAEPFANTPSHDVMLVPAKGDPQVAPITNEITARTDIGIAVMDNYPRDVPMVDTVSYPHDGSGLVMYDFGNDRPAPGNHPPKNNGDDPHEKPRQQAWHNEQMVHFWRTGEIINTCDADGDPVCDPK